MHGLQMAIGEMISQNIPQSIWQTISSFILIPISVVAIFLWSYFYNSQFVKLLIGFVTGLCGFGLILLIPSNPSDQHVIVFLFALLLIVISEVHIAPIVHSILTKFGNPKFLAILISLSLLPTRMFTFIFSAFNSRFYENPLEGSLFFIGVMIFVSIGLIFLVKWSKRML